ncbi:tyrosine phosphatase (macronuclear) [Tetrahymena thermophila SB210]|uniref:protein-tyrosine-phosphatase n=1 Tax=Tetrahymena thermophila (strain SB210) TaxID=312017 RepID=W7X1C7_TETTS|nr:tyrosine phosphatase [Tetrahymena thermophila SB210]EWS73030.1 tyrosine phosphatase [Tetrahymena thermophila SB210]|eukprot:XP_012654427.1 tyrosine phosphatase [Tetrahymena thermophila SB210]
MFGEDKHLILKTQEGQQEKGKLYLGNIWAAENLINQNDEQIKAILTVASNTNLVYDPQEFRHKIIEANDDPSFNLSPNFDEGVRFIDEHLQQTNVLVHCFAGVSRSTTLVLAYLMKHHNIGLDDALKLVRQKRQIAGPNYGFMKQLKEYEQKLKAKQNQ